MKLFYFLLFISSMSIAQAQDSCACCTQAHTQFHFWLGTWEVYDTSDTWLGSNEIVLLQDQCLMQENWTSTSMSGTSYNYYNQADSSWNQVWVDNQGGALILKGGMENGAMVLKSKLLEGNQGLFYNQITWIPKDAKTVIQIWQVKNEKQELLSTLFEGIYKRKE